MKIATWNVNSLAVRLPQLLDWLALHRPDVVGLQETKLADDKFPDQAIRDAGYHVEWFGQKTYNGVALLSTTPASDIVRNIPGHDDHQTRIIAGTVAGVRVVCAYVPNGQSVESEKFPYKLAWLDALRRWIATEQAAHPQLVLMGDYNIAPEDRDVHDPVAWAGQVLCTPEERAHFKALLATGLHDSFRMFEQGPKLYSWWDYRMLAFQKNRGLRIDHILVSDALSKRVTSCVIDKATRKNDRPSDHAPVICELT
ncbi:MAG: exodeoxyribonuclease III [Pseudomonadota bacterium]|nr:exodeoxyribonuclease III [Pseudomonadota bacterium]